MENQFDQFNLSPEIIKALDEMGYSEPTVVQLKAIPRAIERKDLIVISKTGSGKTGAFGIPMTQIIQRGNKNPKALILAPTRELAVQVDQEIRSISKHKKINSTVLYGGHSMVHEIEKLENGVDVVTGTPGRVFDHMQQGNLNLKEIEFLVLDEADRMLDMGFLDQVQRIIKEIPKERVTMLFSATMPNEIQSLCRKYMNSPEIIEIESDTKTVDTVKQYYYKMQPNEKRFQLERILRIEQPESCMVFCNTRMAVDRVNIFLNEIGYTANALHGANTQSNRMRSIQQFKKGAFEILVATDVAARGIHIDDLSLVINYDIPQDKDSYIHRIGRTGRAGNGGKAISFITRDEQYTLYEIEEHIGTLIEEMPLPTDEAVNQTPKRTPKPHSGPKPQSGPKPHSGPKHDHRNKTENRSTHGERPAHGDRPAHGAKPQPAHGTKPQYGAKPQQGAKPAYDKRQNTSTPDKSQNSSTSRPSHYARPVHTSTASTTNVTPLKVNTTNLNTTNQAVDTSTKPKQGIKSWIGKLFAGFKK